MNINATLINLYHVCKRECWLHANGIRMEHTSETVYDGKLLHDVSYPQRTDKYTELELFATINGNIFLSGKIDFYDPKGKVIHETKRSDKVEQAHEWQVKYYIWLLELNGIHNAQGLLEYPKLRQTDMVQLTELDKSYLEEVIFTIQDLLHDESCPGCINAGICKSCSYYELCYVEE